MSLSDSLDEEIASQKIIVSEHGFPNCIRAVYCNFGLPLIILNKNIKTTYSRNAAKAHELGHHYTCPIDLCAASPLIRKKSEVLAERWALRRIMPPEKLVLAYRSGVRALDELSDYLELTPEAVQKGLLSYQQIYGQSIKIGIHIISFDPFNISSSMY